MSRYRKIETCIWADEAIRQLSRPKPSAQFLWFYLLTGPHTGRVPGLFRLRMGGLAEDLGWSLKATKEAWAELEAAKPERPLVVADWDAGLVWLPQAFKHNRPAAPNVIRSWGDTWRDLPECALKRRAAAAILEDLEDGWRDAFGELIQGRHGGMPSANQEQEQEQEQDLTPQGPPGGRSPPAKKAHKPTARGKREARAREVFERTERFRVRVLLKGRGGRKCTPTTTKRLLALVAHVRGSRGCDEPAAWHVVEAYAEGALREAAAALERGRDNATKLVTWRGDGWEWRPSRFDAWASRNETLVDEVIRGIARGPDPLAELAEPEPPADAASLDALRAAQSGAAAARSVS